MIYTQGIDILSTFLRKRNIVRVGFHVMNININVATCWDGATMASFDHYSTANVCRNCGT